MIKRRGPRTEPCGTPQKQVWREEKLEIRKDGNLSCMSTSSHNL